LPSGPWHPWQYCRKSACPCFESPTASAAGAMISSKVKTPRTPKQDTDLKPSSTTHRTHYITIANRFPRPVCDGKVPTRSDSEYTPPYEKSLLYTPSERLRRASCGAADDFEHSVATREPPVVMGIADTFGPIRPLPPGKWHAWQWTS
jgi:hypothetical protein